MILIQWIFHLLSLLFSDVNRHITATEYKTRRAELMQAHDEACRRNDFPKAQSIQNELNALDNEWSQTRQVRKA